MIKLPELEFSGFFTKEMINIKFTVPGIYRIYNSEKVLMYIGKSVNIFNRMYQHFNGSHCDEVLKHNYYYFDFSILNCPVDRDMYETYYINKMKPPINENKVYLYESEREKYIKYLEVEKTFVDFQKIYTVIENITLIA